MDFVRELGGVTRAFDVVIDKQRHDLADDLTWEAVVTALEDEGDALLQAIPDNLDFGSLDFGFTLCSALGDPLFGNAHDLCSGILGERP